MENLFFNHGKDKLLWETEDKILLAISGGVDSMVLLKLMESVARREQLSLYVAHVNHQLREESLQEERYLKEYCKEQNLPFFTTRWQNAPITGMEEAARAFRYSFFSQIMEQTGCVKLMTAHHGDDQVETLVMKLARGGSLGSHIGIKERQQFSSGELVRPLLQFSKEELRQWATRNNLVFFEDQTNEETQMQRNRIRKWVIPQLRKENARLLPHAQQFSQQLEWAEEIISEEMKINYLTYVTVTDDGWIIDGEWLEKQTDGKKYFFLSYFFKKSLEQKKIGAKEEQIYQLMHLMAKEKAQWEISFSKKWLFKKSYQQFSFQKKKKQIEKEYIIHYNEGIYLNENEWLGILKSDEIQKNQSIPKNTEGWTTFQKEFSAELAEKFVLRRRQEGDRLILNEKLVKKISRFFIDNKVPNEKRASSWVLSDYKKNIYGLLPFALSYLSIVRETDKIHYVLLYKYRE